MAEQIDDTRRATLMRLFSVAVEAASAEVAMPRWLPVLRDGRTVVIAAGKAAAAMMKVALERLDGPTSGLLVTRYGHLLADYDFPDTIEVIEAGHPVPDEASVHAAARALQLASQLTTEDHLLILLSGGASSLLAAPVDGVTLAEKQVVTRALLGCGATIAEINCVRKHMSRIKGGRLAVAAGGAAVTSLIISDVPGDDPGDVGSGPAVADKTTLAMAAEILNRYGIAPSPAVVAALADPANETPAADAAGLQDSKAVILACAADALAAAAARADQYGYQVANLGGDIEGEARLVGAEHAKLALRLAKGGGRHVILSGGETTVTVGNDHGRGGRNLEYLLGLALALNGAPGIYALACDTDGIDGTEDNAGAVVTPDTLARARAIGIDAAEHLRRNDAYSYFAALGDLVVTGPTHTNVNDFRVILIDPCSTAA